MTGVARDDWRWPIMTRVAGVGRCGREWPRMTGLALDDPGSRSHG